MLSKKSSNHQQDVMVSALKGSVSRSPLSRLKVKLFVVTGATKRFFREYRLPATVSALFVASLMVFATGRLLERTSIIDLTNNTSEGGYSILLSNDRSDEFTRENSSEPTDPNQNTASQSIANASDSTQSTSNSFSLPDADGTIATGGNSGGSNPSPDPDPGTGGGGGSEPKPDPDPNPDPDPDPPPSTPFTASIDSLPDPVVTLQCSNPSKPKKGTCSKVYSFNASVRTKNGPGTVSYTWQSNLSAGSGNGSFQVGSGDSITGVSNDITLGCNKSGAFTLRLALLDPTVTSSRTVSISHNCNEL